MHNTAADYYDLPLRYFAVQVDEKDFSLLPAYLSRNEVAGVNVTIPYKQQTIGLMDELTEPCKGIGALNTIVKKDKKLVGHNTDIYGFTQPLKPLESRLSGKNAIIFGTGGAACAVCYGLKNLGMSGIILVSRNPAAKNGDSWPAGTQIVSYNQWQEYASDTALFVNTTPLGMAPNIDNSPVKEEEKELLSGKICYDIVYTPLKTTFLHQAEEAGSTTINGLEMFIHQGSRSFELWTGKPFPFDLVRKELMKVLSNDN